jgi:hypothetical protein
MEPRKTPPEYVLEIFADTTTVRDVLKGFYAIYKTSIINQSNRLETGILNLIFFHRYFPSIRPKTFDVLDFTLPAINDVDLETLIDSRISSLVRQHSSSATGHGHGLDPSSGGTATGGGTGGVRGRIAVEFYEKKRRRSGMWFPGLAGKGEEEICWEVWNLEVTIATPRTESGMPFLVLSCVDLERRPDANQHPRSERAKVRRAMENMLQKAALKILSIVNHEKDHIPPITTSDSNPFPYRIVLNPRSDSWQNRFGLY